MTNPRIAIFKALSRVIFKEETLSTDGLSPFQKQFCFGFCRTFFEIDATLEGLLEKPLKQKDEDIALITLMGLYELKHLNTAEHAAVSETVSLVKHIKKTWAKGLVNACLRRWLREKTTPPQDEEIQYNHPQWLIDEIKIAYPNQWQTILTENNQHPPLTLRVNLSKTTKATILETLDANDLPNSATAVTLKEAKPVMDIPGFQEGKVSLQDLASQRILDYLTLSPGLKVLDACAAPGGKTSLLLESEPQLKLIAVELEEKRLEKLTQNLTRLDLHPEKVVCADAGDPATWWDGVPFDAILLDAPCSGTGVIRRHPDIKLLRTPEEVLALNGTQTYLLEALWPLLKPGGQLLYTTCSILPSENEQRIDSFLAEHNDAHSERSHTAMPGDDGQDGFYYHLIFKR